MSAPCVCRVGSGGLTCRTYVGVGYQTVLCVRRGRAAVRGVGLSNCAVHVAVVSGVGFSSESRLRRARGAVLERVQCRWRDVAPRTQRGDAQRRIPVDPRDGDDACV